MLYGNANGFGWKVHDVISAQIVSVPMPLPVARAEQTFETFMGSLAIVFLAVRAARRDALRDRDPARHAARRYHRPGRLGNIEAGQVSHAQQGRIGVLTEAIGRMKAGLVQAVEMLDS